MEMTYEQCVHAAYTMAKASKRMNVPIEIFLDGMALIISERNAGKSIEDCKKSASQYLKTTLPNILQEVV